MTANPDTPSHSRGAMRPRFANNIRPENRGRGECRAPDAPAASCALRVVSMHTSIHSEPPEITRHSRTQWFTAYTARSLYLAPRAGEVEAEAPLPFIARQQADSDKVCS